MSYTSSANRKEYDVIMIINKINNEQGKEYTISTD